MTHKQKISYMRVALAVQNIGLRNVDVDKIVTTYEAIVMREGSLTLKDIVDLELRVEKQNKDIK